MRHDMAHRVGQVFNILFQFYLLYTHDPSKILHNVTHCLNSR